jgi:hypothetical protein
MFPEFRREGMKRTLLKASVLRKDSATSLRRGWTWKYVHPKLKQRTLLTAFWVNVIVISGNTKDFVISV